jgi:membrane peptidoglycan carboxypeptidase
MNIRITKGKSDRFSNLKYNSNQDLKTNSGTDFVDVVPQENLEANAPKNNNLKEEKFLVEDDYYKKSEKILPAGVKNNIGRKLKGFGYSFNKQSRAKADTTNGSSKDNKSFQSLNKLRGKFGFNWATWSRNLALSGVVFIVIILLFSSIFAAWAINRYNEAPNITEGNLFNIRESSVVYANDGKTKIYEFFDKEKREYVSIDQIPEVMQLAALALEDENFYYNPDGIPWYNMFGALVKCVQTAFDECRGGSGIIQQLVKTVQNDNEYSTDRKIRELFTSIKLYNEGTKKDGKKVNKSDILELYLNTIFLGRNSGGIEQASRSYFGHGINERVDNNDPNSAYLLTPPKACYLAALINQPTRFSSSIENRDSESFKLFETKKNSCLNILSGDNRNFSIRGEGKPLLIQTAEELDKWKNSPVDFVNPSISDVYPHFREYITLEISKFLNSIGLTDKDLYRRGLKIVTTLDPDIQKNTEDIVRNSKDSVLAAGGNNAAAIVLDGPTGQIKAMVGSLDYNDVDINGKVNILTSPQQIGSSIKPYVYANLFDKGFNPGTILMDVPTEFRNIVTDPKSVFKPNNFSRKFSGPRTAHYSLSNSLNIPAVEAGVIGSGSGDLDPQKSLATFFDFVENAGLRFPCIDSVDGVNCDEVPETGPDSAYVNRCSYLPTYIGSCEATVLSHATGINTLFQNGSLHTATPFISIVDQYGNELFTKENKDKLYPDKPEVIKPAVARQTTWIMTDQERVEFGQYRKFFNIEGWNLAAKTGTTDNNIDATIVGGSPLYTTVVWAGRTDNKPMNDDTQASNLAAPIWQNIQKSIHNGKTPINFSTEGLKLVNLDKITGMPIDDSKPGNKELLSEEQINLLNKAGEAFAKPDYNPRKSNIFTNRTPIVPRKVKINRVDNNLAVEGKTLSQNIEERVCLDFLSAFPNVPEWYNFTNSWGRNFGNSCGDLKESSQDQVKEKDIIPQISISPDLKDGSNLPGNLTINFNVGSNSKKIIQASIKVNGVLLKNFDSQEGQDQVNLSFNDSEVKNIVGTGGNYTILIETRDNFSITNSKILNNIKIPNDLSTTIVGSFINLQDKYSKSSSNSFLFQLNNLVNYKPLVTITQNTNQIICNVDFPDNTISSKFDFKCPPLINFGNGIANIVARDNQGKTINIQSLNLID